MGERTIYMAAPDGDVFETTDPEIHKGCKRLTRAEGKRRDAEQAREALRALFPPGATVQTILRHVSASGMSRRIAVIAVTEGHARDVSHLVARACDLKLSDKGGLVVGGCGMDMGFAVVYDLSSELYRAGYACLGRGEDGRRRCPSNYHSNHHDRIQCPGIYDEAREEGDRQVRCFRPWRSDDITEGWPRLAPREVIAEDGERFELPGRPAACLLNDDGTPREVCPTCQGIGQIDNPDGPERFDLTHTDGYALRHEWI